MRAVSRALFVGLMGVVLLGCPSGGDDDRDGGSGGAGVDGGVLEGSAGTGGTDGKDFVPDTGDTGTADVDASFGLDASVDGEVDSELADAGECVSKSCDGLCGVTTDDCGGIIDCGECPSGTVCGSEIPGICGPVENGDVFQLAVGTHSCALLFPGRVRCWGLNNAGALGYGTSDNIGDDETPSSAGDVDMGGLVRQISVGGGHTCAVYDGGLVKCWGPGWSFGELGYPGMLTTVYQTPAELPFIDVGAPVAYIVAGIQQTCALLQDGGVKCWGLASAVLGQGHLAGCAQACQEPECCIGDDEPPSAFEPISLGGPATQLALGWAHACAILENGSVRCWGSNAYGRLGFPRETDPALGDDEVPSSGPFVPLPQRALRVAVGYSHSCALLSNGEVWCWGDNRSGQTGTASPDPAPSAVDLGGLAVALAAGYDSTCAVLAGGAMTCWGNGDSGRLGYGNQDTVGVNDIPASVGTVEMGGDVVAVAMHEDYSCALLAGGKVRCWGRGGAGVLGYADTAACSGIGVAFCPSGPTCCIGDDETPAETGTVSIY